MPGPNGEYPYTAEEFVNYQYTGSSSGGSPMSIGAGYQWEYLAYLMATAAGDLAYKNKKLELVDIPMMETQREALANQARDEEFKRYLSYAQTTGYIDPTMDPARGQQTRMAALDYMATDPNKVHAGNADWQNASLETRRGWVQNWLNTAENPDVINAARDPLKVAQGMGWQPSPEMVAPQKTLQREAMEEGLALDREKLYTELLAGLSGPRDWHKYQTARRAIGDTNNMRSPVAAAMKGGQTLNQLGYQDKPVDTWGDKFKKWMLG